MYKLPMEKSKQSQHKRTSKTGKVSIVGSGLKKETNEDEKEYSNYKNIKFPIDNLKDLESFYKQNYLEVTGEKPEHTIKGLAAGKSASEIIEQNYAREFINYMREGLLTNPKITSKILDNLDKKYFN